MYTGCGMGGDGDSDWSAEYDSTGFFAFVDYFVVGEFLASSKGVANYL